MSIENKLIQNGVSGLKEFGYEGVTEENILTDEIYSRFFKSMLKDSLGQGFDEEITKILSKLPK